ncbi:MAG: radical SAM protein [Anaerolineae bacterium]|nr:radical SAM protein [Anaerolineae bacterium]
MSVLELQRGVTYGPIHSRRLGRSLGINLLPAGRKVCTFDCVYCQYGSAETVTDRGAKTGFPSLETVLDKLEEAIGRQASPPDYLTFSGNGEPTLHPQFAEIVAEVRRLRDRMCPEARLAILSNSTLLHRGEVRRAVEALDDPIMKLDAGEAMTLQRINRPGPGVSFDNIMDGLAALPRLIIQSMIISGEVANAEGEALEGWLSAIAQLAPLKVQIYSTERPVAEAGVHRVSKEVLNGLAKLAQERTGIPVAAY